jgi:hypothetical protein
MEQVMEQCTPFVPSSQYVPLENSGTAPFSSVFLRSRPF